MVATPTGVARERERSRVPRSGQNWIFDQGTALNTVIILNAWTTSGTFMLFYLASLQSISGQVYEYTKLGFLPDNGIFAAVFFTLTGFHGAHVTGGILMNALVLFRATKGHFTAQRHLAVEAASIYWHFVDVVWIGLFTIIYIIG